MSSIGMFFIGFVLGIIFLYFIAYLVLRKYGRDY